MATMLAPFRVLIAHRQAIQIFVNCGRGDLRLASEIIRVRLECHVVARHRLDEAVRPGADRAGAGVGDAAGGTDGRRAHKACETDELRLEIADTGHGISEDEAKKIFEPFYTTKEQGLGLGMPYAKKIVDQHGGTISLSSQPGKGTTISIVLPAGKEVDDAS